MMKCGLNKLLWPYSGIALLDETNSLCVCLEGFVFGERFGTYRGMSDFLRKHTPLRPLSSVNIVSGDGFFDQKLIQSMGFINATFVMDRWHLRESGLLKMFGPTGYGLLKIICTDSLEQ